MNEYAVNVRAIRPMRILLVTDDVRYADEFSFAGSERGVEVEQVTVGDDLDALMTGHIPSIVVFDAHDSFARTSRTATVFAALHPQIATVVVANRAAKRSIGSVFIFDKWRSAERLLSELERVSLGLSVPGEIRSTAGE